MSPCIFAEPGSGSSMRCLGIDYGEKRIGLALSDPEGAFSFPLTTLDRSSDRNAIRQIRRIVEQEQVEQIVVGEPRNLDGSRGPAAERAVRFAQKLKTKTGLRCCLIDESLTSVAAEERLRHAGVDLRRHPERVDAVAAQILLQQFLEHPRTARDG